MLDNAEFASKGLRFDILEIKFDPGQRLPKPRPLAYYSQIRQIGEPELLSLGSNPGRDQQLRDAQAHLARGGKIDQRAAAPIRQGVLLHGERPLTSKGRGMPASALLLAVELWPRYQSARAAVNVAGARASQDARAVRQAAAPLAAGDRERRARRHAHARGRIAQECRGRIRRRSAHGRETGRLRADARQRAADMRPSPATISFARWSCRYTAAGSRLESAARAPHRRLSKRAIAQREFLATGDDTKLRKLRKTKILDASGREIPFLTDEDELARQGDLGTLSYESIYARRG